MDWTQVLITGVTVLISSGIIQFFVTRKDKQKEDAKQNHDETIKKDMRDHLTNVNAKWKLDYCDKNAKAIADLAEEVKVGLAEREAMGKKRYDEHHLSIERMDLQHQKDAQALFEAIRQLEANNTKITDSLVKIADKQEIMAESLVGQAHDRILFLTDKISERGAITNREKATIKSMYEPYKKLGGNGVVSENVNYIMGLTVVSEEDARQMDIENKRKEKLK